MKRYANAPITTVGRNATSRLRSEAELLRVMAKAGRGAGEAAEILPAHRADRAQLDDDFEYLTGWAAKTDQIDGEDQMPGGGNRKELGQALDHAEEESSSQDLQIHGVRRRSVRAGVALAEDERNHLMIRATDAPCGENGAAAS